MLHSVRHYAGIMHDFAGIVKCTINYAFPTAPAACTLHVRTMCTRTYIRTYEFELTVNGPTAESSLYVGVGLDVGDCTKCTSSSDDDEFEETE